MERNMGLEDRTIRPVVAMALMGICFNEKVPAFAKGALLAGSAFLIVTSLLGKCPVYAGLSINTRKSWTHGAREIFR